MWPRRAAEFACLSPGAERITQRLRGPVSGHQQRRRRRHASALASADVMDATTRMPTDDVVVPHHPEEHGPSSITKSPTHVYNALSSSNGECLDYVRGWAWQQLLLNRRLAARRSQEGRAIGVKDDPGRGSQGINALVEGLDPPCAPNDPDIVMLLEHQHVYTLGRGADERHLTFLGGGNNTRASNEGDARQEDEDLHTRDCRQRLSRSARGPGSARLSLDRRHSILDCDDAQLQGVVDQLCRGTVSVRAPNGTPIYRVERGGECTYHGPGQLVVYPMLDLKRQPKADLHNYLRRLEDVVIQTLRVYDIEGIRDDINTGVWVDHRKVAAVGVSSSRWITTHGFALNVGPDLDYFDTSMILPCGIEGRGVTSIRKILSERGLPPPTVQAVSRVALEQLIRVFNLDVELWHQIS